jgi:hypothetical protein
MNEKKEFKYDIDSICQTFKEHAQEVSANVDEITIVGGFNFPRALQAICEELIVLRGIARGISQEQ